MALGSVIEQIIGIVGGIAGMISLAIVLYKTSKERPNLSFTIENSSWYVHHPDAKFTTVSVTLRIDNNGDRNTTVHTANMYFEQNGKRCNSEKLSWINCLVEASGTTNKTFDFHFPLKDVVITNDIVNSIVVLEHTHGSKSISIPIIKKSQYY